MTYAYLISDSTVPAFPLGQPVDGRERFGMTPNQAKLYRWLVDNRPHNQAFQILFREVADAINMNISAVHWLLTELCERGWLHCNHSRNHLKVTYAFVHPVMTFRGKR